MHRLPPVHNAGKYLYDVQESVLKTPGGVNSELIKLVVYGVAPGL